MTERRIRERCPSLQEFGNEGRASITTNRINVGIVLQNPLRNEAPFPTAYGSTPLGRISRKMSSHGCLLSEMQNKLTRNCSALRPEVLLAAPFSWMGIAFQMRVALRSFFLFNFISCFSATVAVQIADEYPDNPAGTRHSLL
jgi:hypothetical protein